MMDLKDKLQNFFFLKDSNSFCVGCNNCFLKSETLCPHYERLKPIAESIDNADIIILSSYVYCYHVTGSMKAFLDHYGYRWMVYKPKESVVKKQGCFLK